jgi:hypothetical protein
VSGIPVFWIEPTGRILRTLRRYHSPRGSHPYNCADGWHEARSRIEPLDEIPIRGSYDVEPDERETSGDLWPHDDPRWPAECQAGCGYRFTDDDHWQLHTERVYKRIDGASDDELTLVLRDDRALPPGAMWDAWWYPDGWKIEGISLVVQLPDGVPWTVDGPSTSCPSRNGGEPHDTRTGHRCWTRTGDPKAIPPTVDVNPSILSGKPETYHGYLRHGQLVPT